MNTEEKDDIYNIKEYTDKELLQILDLASTTPTDRELEAKIILFIKKYNFIPTENAKKLTKFFNDIYDHFFENENEENDENNFIEGFTAPIPTISPEKSEQQPEISNPIDQVKLNKNVPVSRGQLNPVLNQTITRVISIDSQFRDNLNNKSTTLSTDFTFDLSEPLRDVVSLKLYSIQLPFTWYTIDSAFGSNFFLLEPTVPSLQNGNYALKFEIPPGNYTNTTIFQALNTSLQNLKTTYPDVSFGLTDISYNPINALTTLYFDIQNIYGESQYRLVFEGPTSPFNVFNRTKSIANFLGYSYPSYSTTAIYSQFDNIKYNFNNDTTTPYYYVDSSNNYFTLIQYLATPTNLDANTVPTLTNIDPYLSPGSPQFGDPNTTIIQTFDISFSSFIKLDMSYSRSTLLTDLNNQLKNTAIYPFIDVSNSGIFLTGIQDLSCSYNIRDVSYVELDLKLSRYTTQNIYNYKTCIQFPAENTPPNNSRYIWRDIIGNGTSCFNFDASRTYFELNNINGEDTPLITNYVIDQNPYILLRCIRQQYDFSFNDFVIKVENSANIDTEGYLLTEYIQEINRGIFNANKTSISPDNNDLNLPTTDLSYNIIPNFLLPPNNGITWNTYCFQDPNNFIVNFQFDITRKFTENRYMIDPSNTILLDILGIDITSETDISGNNPFTCIFPIRANGYNVPFNIPIIKFILKDQYNGSPINYIRYDVYMDASGDQSTTVKTYLTAADMVTDINLALSNFLFYYSRLGVQFSDNPIQGTQLSFLQSLGQQFKTTLDVNINVTLTTEDYQAVFYDGSGGYYDNSGYYFNESPWSSAGSWSQNLFFTDQSYNLINYITTGNYADISGSKLVLANEIILTDSNNHIYFEPISTANGLVQGNNTITLTLSAGIVYSRIGLLDEINTQIHANPLLTGSYFYVDNNGRCRIRVNINQIFTSNNYQLVFYDSINFVKCYVGATSVRNVSWDSTLGWILGFRQQTTYDLSGYYTSNVPSGTASITGDSTVALNLYNYFMIILDDFNQNHLNDGLVTITKKDYGIYNSSYSARSPNVCNNPAISSNQLSITDTAIIQNFDGNNTKTNLTQNQIYSNLQLLNANKTNNTLVQTSPGPYIKDIFGIIPLKTAGLSPGQPYIEFGGTLQAQERVYFGPVNIHRMRIQLITDHGDIINLNGQNWSFSLLCEQLYQNRAV